ncbi:DUF2933 domain-containing protein [Paucibacter sp. O1-1]|uniref:DUF2933 domain-containing protein n=1 Tax=Paucibacter sp. M5-1 TaxID=3015998 RepID=UPI0010F5C285|nr:DUF2933 domain-containing protein [Paucibacter sp. O1-1]MDA3830695.1 DUF2933 domain-containing protein [Paucibacter sp. O1-1]
MDPNHQVPRFWRSRAGIAWIVLAGVAGWFLWAEHRAHLLGALPYLIILACPLMHLFIHRGHHQGGQHADHHDARDQGGKP